MTNTDNSEKKLANTLGGTLWKGYEDLMDAMKPAAKQPKSNNNTIPANQISPALDKRENKLIDQGKSTPS